MEKNNFLTKMNPDIRLLKTNPGGCERIHRGMKKKYIYMIFLLHIHYRRKKKAICVCASNKSNKSPLRVQ